MSFVKLNISSSRIVSVIFARFGCIISVLVRLLFQLERSSQVHRGHAKIWT